MMPPSIVVISRSYAGSDASLTRVRSLRRLSSPKAYHFVPCVASRLYPQLPVNVRIAAKNTVIPKGGGADGQSPVMIPKGKGIGWSTYHMHRQKDLYGSDAESYRPERWETGELDNIGWGFMPFHGGPRLCLGSKDQCCLYTCLTTDRVSEDFALMEASCVIVRILQTFPRIRLPDDALVEPTGQERQSLGILITSAEGCKVVLD